MRRIVALLLALALHLAFYQWTYNEPAAPIIREFGMRAPAMTVGPLYCWQRGAWYGGPMIGFATPALAALLVIAMPSTPRVIRQA